MNNDNEKVVLQFDELLEALGENVSLAPAETQEEVQEEEVVETQVQMMETESGNIITVDEEELKNMNDESTDKFSDLDDFYKELYNALSMNVCSEYVQGIISGFKYNIKIMEDANQKVSVINV